jgi:antitoxin ParD1/3/4
LVASGVFRTADEAVEEGVRLLMSRQQLRAEIQQGIDELNAGLGIPAENVFAELRQRSTNLADGA